jgi:hypothetical protein
MQTISRNPAARTAPPPRHVRPNPNATQEVQAGDVLEIIEKGGLAARPAPLPRFEEPVDEISVEIVPDESPRFRTSSASSIAPVDLNLAPPLDDEMTGSIDVVATARRKRFGLLVGAAVGACSALLLLAIGFKLAGSSSDGDLAKASGVGTTVQTTPAATTQSPAAATPITTTPAAKGMTAAATPATASTIGTLVIESKAKKVWLDGKRLNGSSAMIPCGSHTVKLGKSSVQTVDVPCGGEYHVSRP